MFNLLKTFNNALQTFLSTNSIYKILLLLFFCFISLLFNFLRGFLLIQNLGLKSYVLLLINVISLLIILEDCCTIMKKHWMYLWIWPFFAVTIMHILKIRFVTVKRKVKLSYHKKKKIVLLEPETEIFSF